MELPRSAFAGTGSIRTHAVRDAPVAKEQEAYPVLVFSHGRCEVREHNTFRVEELASHGYVVVTIDHPSAASGVRFPDGRLVEFDARLLPPWPRYAPDDPEAALLDSVIPFLADDVHFVLRRIAALNADPEEVLGGRLDLGRVGGVRRFPRRCSTFPSAGSSWPKPVSASRRSRRCLMMDGYVPPNALAAGLGRRRCG
jgi:hypothetical protein